MIVNEKSNDSCATIIQNFTYYPATLPRVIIGYIEIPITQTTPPHYRVNDVNSLIHSVIHAYHPDTTTPIKQTPYADMNLCTRVTPQSLLEINKIEINDKTLQLPIPSVTRNLRPSDKNRKDFPPLPYSTENQQFIKKFNFEYSDLTDTEYVNICNIFINNQHCYAKHKNDVGKISTPFRIRIKDNCKLQTQRPSKVPNHYRDRLNKLLLELEKYNIIKQIGSTSDEKHTIGTTFLNPLIIIPKGDAIKVVLDARHLNSNTNQELESWPIEPLAPQLARANKKYKSTIDLMYPYAHTPLDKETIKLTGFSSGDKLYAFIRGFYGVKGPPNFFTKQMSTFFRSLIDKRSAVVYIDDILLLAIEKQEMFELIKELHTIASRENLKLAPEKSFYMLLKVKFLGHEIMIDIVAIVENIRKTTTDLILDKDITIDLEAHIDLDLIIIIKEELHLDLHIDLHIEITQITGITLAQDTDLVLNHKETRLNDIIIHIDLHQDLEILDHDLEHPHETDNKTE